MLIETLSVSFIILLSKLKATRSVSIPKLKSILSFYTYVDITRLPNNGVGKFTAKVVVLRFFIPKRVFSLVFWKNLINSSEFLWKVSLLDWGTKQGRKKAADIASVSTTEVRSFTGLCEVFVYWVNIFTLSFSVVVFSSSFFLTYPNFLWILGMKVLSYNCWDF